MDKKTSAKPFERGSVSEEISLISANHKMDEDDIIRVIEKATGVTMPETDDLLESLTDDQVVAVWKHMMKWDEGQCSLCRSIIPAGDPRVFRAQDEIFCSEACAREAEENR